MKKRTNWWTITRIIFIASILGAILFAAVSCKPKLLITTKTEYVERLKYDSIYVQKYDSIYVEKTGDTVRIEKYKTIFKDRFRIQKDTVSRIDTFTTIPQIVTKTQPVQVYGFFWWTGLLTLIAVCGFIIFKFTNFQIFKFK